MNVARLAGIDAEEALQGAIEKFRRRFAHMEADLATRKDGDGRVTADELERLWDDAKAAERRPGAPGR